MPWRLVRADVLLGDLCGRCVDQRRRHSLAARGRGTVDRGRHLSPPPP